MPEIIKVLFGCALISALLSPVLNAADNHVYTVGIIPQFEVRQTQAVWRPILDELEQRTGLKFTLRGFSTIPTFEQEFLAGEFDFAYMNPHQVVLAQQYQTYIPMVRDIGADLYGIIVVPKNSDINSVEQLNGKVLVFPAPNAIGATLMPRAELLDKFGVSVVPRYVQTHSSVYLSVILGEAVAGGGVQKTLSQQPDNVRNALRVLYRTRSVSAHPFTAHSRVPEAVRLKVRDALLALAETARGKELLSKVPIQQLGPASLEDYKPLTDMRLKRFEYK